MNSQQLRRLAQDLHKIKLVEIPNAHDVTLLHEETLTVGGDLERLVPFFRGCGPLRDLHVHGSYHAHAATSKWTQCLLIFFKDHMRC